MPDGIAGWERKLVEGWLSLVSFKVGNHVVTLKGTVSALGLGAQGHVDWGKTYSIGAGATLLLYGASASVSVSGGN
jgi:hypothetical protein